MGISFTRFKKFSFITSLTIFSMTLSLCSSVLIIWNFGLFVKYQNSTMFWSHIIYYWPLLSDIIFSLFCSPALTLCFSYGAICWGGFSLSILFFSLHFSITFDCFSSVILSYWTQLLYMWLTSLFLLAFVFVFLSCLTRVVNILLTSLTNHPSRSFLLKFTTAESVLLNMYMLL